MTRPSVEVEPGVVLTRKYTVPPAVMADRMQRYSVYLMICAFLLLAVNFGALSLEAVLWFAASVSAGFALLCAIAVVMLHAVAWNFERMREELRGGRSAVDMRDPATESAE
jgi:membrane protein YdbS with pleckstrin-like domain